MIFWLAQVLQGRRGGFAFIFNFLFLY